MRGRPGDGPSYRDQLQPVQWQPVGALDTDLLEEARLQIHHAAQVLAIGIGRSLLPARDDDSHTTLSWDPKKSCWWSQPIPAMEGLRAGLSPADLTLQMATDTFSLAGRTLAEAWEWLRESLARHGLSEGVISMDAHYDMPAHPVANGARFDEPVVPGCVALAAHYANAHTLVSEVVAERDDASSVVTWPHHFDLASLRTLGKRDGDGCSIGIGLSPGDSHVPEPYYYVTPWPVPRDDQLPTLPAGHWRRADFFGALLPASDFVHEDDPMSTVRRYLAVAIQASERWLADCVGDG